MYKGYVRLHIDMHANAEHMRIKKNLNQYKKKYMKNYVFFYNGSSSSYSFTDASE